MQECEFLTTPGWVVGNKRVKGKDDIGKNGGQSSLITVIQAMKIRCLGLLI